MPPFRPHIRHLLPPSLRSVHLPNPLPSCLLSSLCVPPCSILVDNKHPFSSSSSSSSFSSSSSSSSIRSILSRLGQGTLTPTQAEEALLTLQQQQQEEGRKGYDNVDCFAKIDYAREARTGLPEIIYGEGKTPEQLLAILHSMGSRRQAEENAEETEAATQNHHQEKGFKIRTATSAAAAAAVPPSPEAAAHGVIVASRVSSEKYAALQALMKGEGGREGGVEAYGSLEYLPVPRLLVLRPREKEIGREGGRAPSLGLITVMCAGTADLSVAEEAATLAELCGVQVQRVYDVGVAGIHRLFAALETIRKSQVVVCVAGMDGALPTVVAGLLPCPVIAVPTSVGYGVGKDGLAPLLTMLNACAPGVACVNIDNGIGAAGMVVKILRGVNRE